MAGCAKQRQQLGIMGAGMADHRRAARNRALTQRTDDGEHQIAHGAPILGTGIAAGGEITLDDRVGGGPAIARGGDHLIQYLDGGLKPCGGDHPPVG